MLANNNETLFEYYNDVPYKDDSSPYYFKCLICNHKLGYNHTAAYKFYIPFVWKEAPFLSLTIKCQLCGEMYIFYADESLDYSTNPKYDVILTSKQASNYLYRINYGS